MSSPPVQMSDLPDGNSSLANDASAVVLMRSGLTDYKCAVSIIRQINLFILAQTNPIPSDLMLISRGSASNPSNLAVTFSQVGFPAGTRMWFYQNPPPNWQIVQGTGNSLCAVADQSPAPYGGYNGNGAGVNTGTWQQTDTILTVDQIPSHTHGVRGSRDTISSQNTNYARYGDPGSSHIGPDIISRSTGGSLGHNHGNTWRPMANVGTIGIKLT